ncbi:MAG: hypothetical protein WC734_02460 [Patescibacteria group bacterium]|jgi:hypothetical protein
MSRISHKIVFWLGHRHTQRLIIWLGVFALSTSLILLIAQSGHSTGLDEVTVELMDSEVTSAASRVKVTFTIETALVNGNTVKYYIGDTTGGGNNWGISTVTTGDISCADDGAGGGSYTINSITPASATTPMWVQVTVVSSGAGATELACTIGDGTPNPTNPGTAGAYSVAVVTTNDSGAGIAYVGHANDVTVSGVVLSNLTLNLDNPDTVACSLSGVIMSCNLGTFTLADVNSGYYDVNVGTNAANGATLLISENQQFQNGGVLFDDVVNDESVSAGSEEYGIQVVADAPTWTELGTFAIDDSPIPTGSPVALASTSTLTDKNGPDIKITHLGAISSTTPAGVYSHIVTWTATGNF